ncbi:DUF2884 family protein [Pseudolysobacter antarcticus]|uniref:DUF2884 family protein n=1 Tax=Pseudolysobacter antarcticus TaxID=2511995 RepID=A0A411HH97_9GAMM|nr:DUF2884 family protein [Pseudolysobacter antarcticus]QBB69899.1 DUF2884 family protein [Pseudolysobacter antarcticus]
MKIISALAVASTLLFASPLFAHDVTHSCSVHSDYNFNFSDKALSFTNTNAKPRSIELRQGRLFIDGQEQVLSAADQKRIADLESGTRRLLAQVKEIGLDAADIAFDAIESVAVALTATDAKQQETLHRRLAFARDELRRGIDSRIQGSGWTDADIGQLVESSVKAMLPTLISQVTADAVRIALSGDEAAIKELEARADRMGKDIETKVEARAKVLEQRADALCPQFAQLGEIAAALDVRIDGQRPLELFTR